MNQNPETIALIYDFDGTLTPKAMQDYTLLPKLGIPAEEFWSEVQAEVKATSSENMLVYMRLLLEKAREKNITIQKQDYRELADKIQYFAGVEGWFDYINQYVKQHSPNIEIKHYLISAGMAEILDGVSIRKHFTQMYASAYHFDKDGVADFPKIVITDTTKTQYLFRINKGKEDLSESINEHMPEEDRPIPFENMIYIGDGMTDVPSMALTKKSGGHAIAVYNKNEERQLSVCKNLMKSGRADFIAPADYTKESELSRRTVLLLDHIMANIHYKHEILECEKNYGI